MVTAYAVIQWQNIENQRAEFWKGGERGVTSFENGPFATTEIHGLKVRLPLAHCARMGCAPSSLMCPVPWPRRRRRRRAPKPPILVPRPPPPAYDDDGMVCVDEKVVCPTSQRPGIGMTDDLYTNRPMIGEIADCPVPTSDYKQGDRDIRCASVSPRALCMRRG